MGILDNIRQAIPAINPPPNHPPAATDAGEEIAQGKAKKEWIALGMRDGLLTLEQALQGAAQAYVKLLQTAPAGWFTAQNAPPVAPPAAALASAAEKYPELAAKAAAQQPETMVIQPTSPTAAPEPAKRGRKPGSKNRPKDGNSMETAATGHNEDTSFELGEIGTLYIDCAPGDDRGALLSDFLIEAKNAVCTLLEVPDYRMVDYGKGTGALAATFGEQMDKRSVQALIVDTRLAETPIVLLDLMGRAHRVIRSFR